MAKKIKNEIEQIEEEVDEITTFIKQTTEALRTIIITLKAMEAKQKLIWESINGVAPEKVIRKASPGFGDVTGLGKHTIETLRKVVEYTKKDGSIGLKIKGGDVIYKDQAYRYLQECKYGCENYISFDNYKKGQKALHIGQDLVAIGRYCPKYADGEE